MIRKHLIVTVTAVVLLLGPLAPGSAHGATAGKAAQWIKISPRSVSTNAKAFGGNNFGFLAITTDPRTGAVYVGTCYQGLWKSTNEGKSWIKVNTGTNGNLLDSGRLWTLAIDPVNPQVLYTSAGYGVGGVLKSTDGGVDWTNMTANGSAIQSAVQSTDIYSISIDPRNNNHILASFHGYFAGGSYANKSPIIESNDGGVTWKIHTIRSLSYPQYVTFLGNSSTWLVGTTAKGFWRTTDAGKSWNEVSKVNFADGGSEAYRAHDGSWYVTSSGAILRSRNDGRSWKSLGLSQNYMGITGDGKYLYTAPITFGNPTHFLAASESKSARWVSYNSQVITNGPMDMAYDRVHHLVYSSNWLAGVWVLDARHASLQKMISHSSRTLASVKSGRFG